MLGFLNSHASLLSAAVNLGMLCVWVVYLQLFVRGYRRQRQSAILITRGSSEKDARCVITNMGAEQVYVTSLIGKFETRDDAYEFTFTDLRELTSETDNDPKTTMLQGSLATGQSMDLGRFEDIIRHMRREQTGEELRDSIDVFELTVVALYGSERLPVGARRRFWFPIDNNGSYAIRPETIQTLQLVSRSARRTLLAKLQEHL